MDASQPPGVTYAMHLGPADVGARAVLRRRLPDGRLTDVLGVILAWADGWVSVATRSGEVEVAVADLVAGKRIPPPPVRRGPGAAG